MRDPRGLPVHDPELEPQAARPCGDRLASVRDAQLGTPEHVDELEWSGGRHRRLDRREGGDTEDLVDVRVDRHAIEVLVEQVAEDAERGPVRVVGRTDDRDPSGGSQSRGDGGGVQRRDRTVSFLEIEERGRPIALLAGQVTASRSYGWPSAAGGMLRPMKPASTMIVTMYGRAS